MGPYSALLLPSQVGLEKLLPLEASEEGSEAGEDQVRRRALCWRAVPGLSRRRWFSWQGGQGVRRFSDASTASCTSVFIWVFLRIRSHEGVPLKPFSLVCFPTCNSRVRRSNLR